MAETTDDAALLRAVLANAPVGLAFFDRDRRFVRINEALAAMSGLSVAEHLGRTPTEVHGPLGEMVEACIDDVFATGRVLLDNELTAPATATVPSRTWLSSWFPVTIGEEIGSVGVVVVEITGRMRAAEHLSSLQSLTARLSAARDVESVGSVVVAESGRGLGATAAALCLLDVGAAELVLLAQEGMDPRTLDRWSRFPLTAPVPAVDAVRTGEMVILRSIDERDERYPVFRGTPTPHESFAVVPLLLEGRTLGVLSLSWGGARPFDDEDRRFLSAVADQCAQGLERARLADAQRIHGEHQAFLADASRVLSSSLDYEATLAQIGRLLVPDVGDSASVYLVEHDGLRLVAVANRLPEQEDLMRRLAEREGERIHNAELDKVVASGESEFYPQVPQEVWADMAEDAEHQRMLVSLSVHSGMAVPLRHEGVTVGVLACTRDRAGRSFAPDDLALVEDLAGRVAAAIANARTHRARTDEARTLQRSLLPPTPLAMPGVEVATRYHPVGDGSEVGGDFYDLFALGDDRWGVVMGDVSGKGVPAASLTALARHTVRAAATWETSPSGVLRVLNRAILDYDVSEQFCTIVHGQATLADGRLHLVISCGGHPLPLVLAADGTVRPVGEPGTGIGLFPSPSLVDTAVVLGSGDSLVLYTDGVVEARSPEGFFKPELLGQAVAGAAGADAEGVADAIERAVLRFEGGVPRDDMAVLVLRVPRRGEGAGSDSGSAPVAAEPPDYRADYPADVTSVPRARREFARWFTAVAGQAADDDTVLIVAELVANAARAARTTFEVHARVVDEVVELEIVDDGPGLAGALPAPGEVPDPGAEEGRGLYLVRLMADALDIVSEGGRTTARCRRRLERPNRPPGV